VAKSILTRGEEEKR